jgi:hypothetical protein
MSGDDLANPDNYIDEIGETQTSPEAFNLGNNSAVSATATAQSPSDLEYVWTISTNQIPLYDPNDLPLTDNARNFINQVSQNIAGVPDVCSIGGFVYAGLQSKIPKTKNGHGFAGYLGSYDSKTRGSNNALVEVSGKRAGGAIAGGAAPLESLAFLPISEAGGVLVGASKERLSVGGYVGAPEKFLVGAGTGAYLTISTMGNCYRQR